MTSGHLFDCYGKIIKLEICKAQLAPAGKEDPIVHQQG